MLVIRTVILTGSQNSNPHTRQLHTGAFVDGTEALEINLSLNEMSVTDYPEREGMGVETLD